MPYYLLGVSYLSHFLIKQGCLGTKKDTCLISIPN